MQCVCKTNHGFIGNIFFIFNFSEQYVLYFFFFQKLRGRFTHGTVHANIFFSDNFNVFSKGSNKKVILLKDLSVIKYLKNITHGWFQEFIKATFSHETMNIYVHIHCT